MDATGPSRSGLPALGLLRFCGLLAGGGTNVRRLLTELPAAHSDPILHLSRIGLIGPSTRGGFSP